MILKGTGGGENWLGLIIVPGRDRRLVGWLVERAGWRGVGGIVRGCGSWSDGLG